LPRVGNAERLWGRTLVLVSVVLGLFLLDRLALLFMDYWLLESLGFESVFWTNFRMGVALFAIGAATSFAAVLVPAAIHGVSAHARKRTIHVGVLVAIGAGLFLASRYMRFLLLFNGEDFGQVDPVFEHDFGFYVFDLPAIMTSLGFATMLGVIFLASSIVCSYLVHRDTETPGGMRRLTAVVGMVSTRTTVIALATLGLLLAADAWIQRYDVLTKDNYDSSIPSGAEYLDVTGFFSSVNGYTVSALAILFGLLALALRLTALHRATTGATTIKWRKLGAVSLILTLAPGAAIDSSFRAMVALRNETQVTPNEPVVQLPYIKRHIDATRAAFGLDQVETVEFSPNQGSDPAPDAKELLDSPTLKNAPLWPGYVSWLEELVDPEYASRVLQTQGDTTIYGPTLDTFQQQEKLRPYYEFMDVDTVRYNVDGEDRLFTTSVRELPLVEPQPWLAWWGQQFVLFTHGQGRVMAPLSEANSNGEPVYVSRGIPPEATFDELDVPNPDIYYGEGSGSMGYSNVDQVAEHDYPTEQGRAESRFPADVAAGVRMDSVLKRLVFGWKSRQFFDILFSDLIETDTRVHYFRTPLERIEHVAPFLYVDSDPYAISSDGRMKWMMNGMTTTDKYPYSMMAELGDKSDRRTPTPQPVRDVNYIADSVKVVLDAYTGQMDLYKIKDEPVIDTWANVYPDLFQPQESMPPEIEEQMQYPVQLFHTQFDDLYIYYHMTDPLTFFSFEDAFDDGDEVVGPVLSEGRSITFSIEPYYWLAQTGDDLPASADETQFALSMVFTPEGALNLRSIITAYQEGEDYGKLSMLRVPKGEYFPGPEQADSAIDQDSFISQQIGLWNRRGLEVIRGHTTPLVIDGEVLYVEPLFIRSKQNPVPQMKRVVVVYRGTAGMGRNLEEALLNAMQPGASSLDAPVVGIDSATGDIPETGGLDESTGDGGAGGNGGGGDGGGQGGGNN
jgi:uncharacterized membrane protein (UPF0182 family)